MSATQAFSEIKYEILNPGMLSKQSLISSGVGYLPGGAVPGSGRSKCDNHARVAGSCMQSYKVTTS
jgi:hypothetical protein